MPKNVDAVALFFIVSVLLFTGFVADHGPVCMARKQITFSDRAGRWHHRYMMLPNLPPAPPVPRVPALPPLPRI